MFWILDKPKNFKPQSQNFNN